LIKDCFFKLDSGSRRGHSSKLFKKQNRLDIRKYTVRNQIVDKWNSLSQDCIYCTTINAFKEHFQKHPQEPETHYTNSVSLDRGLHRQQPVFTVAISGIALVASVNSVKVWNTVIPQPTKHGVTYLSKAALAEHFEYGEVSESHPFLERIRLALV